jgi:hypothetical protein
MSEELSLRDSLTTQFAAQTEEAPQADPVAVETTQSTAEPVESEIESIAQANETSEQKADRLRDEKGKFARKPDDHATQSAPVAQPVADPLPERPKTWKKDYLPMWDKIAKGEQLTVEEGRKLAAYQTQRETEYQSGINQYKTAAQNAQHLTEALTPYVPLMQHRGISAQTFVKQLGDAYQTLYAGTPQQKLNALAGLANDVGIPLHTIAQVQGGGQVDPIVPQLMQQIDQLKNEVYGVKSWHEQQEIKEAQGIISKFTDAEKYPHFDLVRADMGNLLLQGQAKTPEEAYARAIRLNDEAWEAEQERQAQLRQPVAQVNKPNPIAKAKAAVVSPKSSAPNGLAGSSGSGEIAELLKRGFAQSVGRV